MTKKELSEKLIRQGTFWSYNIDNLEVIPDSLLIEQTLRWADVPEYNDLFRLFPFETIKKVWEKKMIPDKRIYPHNYYLAKIFFGIENPESYIIPLQKQNSRYERLKILAS
jgi:hypothetical protein